MKLKWNWFVVPRSGGTKKSIKVLYDLVGQEDPKRKKGDQRKWVSRINIITQPGGCSVEEVGDVAYNHVGSPTRRTPDGVKKGAWHGSSG